MFKSGFVSIIGRPNAGKSTLVNYCVGSKVSIISPKPQTTRNVIQGIYTDEDAQIIFLDTPGIHKPHHELGKEMNNSSIHTLRDCDLICYLYDASTEYGSGDMFVLNLLKKVKTPIIFVCNKMDLVKNNEEVIKTVKRLENEIDFKSIHYISSTTGAGINSLLREIKSNLEEGPMYYQPNQVSDHPEEFIISEIVREKILYKTNEEVPHSTHVTVDEIHPLEENKDALHIRCTIYVEKQSQKKIIIGNQGKMIKDIGTLARKDIVMIMGKKVYLELWVKVVDDWRNKRSTLRTLGILENNN